MHGVIKRQRRMAESDEKEYYKTPTFSGSDEDWHYYKIRMEAALARADLGDLMDEDVGMSVKPHGYVETNAALKDAVELLQKRNQKAAGMLLSSIKNKTEEGKAAFHMIERYHNKANGFQGGHFYNAWKALLTRYEGVQIKNVRDLKREYHVEKMGLEEKPTLFIVKLDRIRNELQRLGHDIEETEFIQDVLGKLPESKNKGIMTPYQVERRMIDSRMETNP